MLPFLSETPTQVQHPPSPHNQRAANMSPWLSWSAVICIYSTLHFYFQPLLNTNLWTSHSPTHKARCCFHACAPTASTFSWNISYHFSYPLQSLRCTSSPAFSTRLSHFRLTSVLLQLQKQWPSLLFKNNIVLVLNCFVSWTHISSAQLDCKLFKGKKHDFYIFSVHHKSHPDTDHRVANFIVLAALPAGMPCFDVFCYTAYSWQPCITPPLSPRDLVLPQTELICSLRFIIEFVFLLIARLMLSFITACPIQLWALVMQGPAMSYSFLCLLLHLAQNLYILIFQ